MARGNRREHLFQDDSIKVLLITTLGEAATRYGWNINAYAIMDNHYHILMETPQPNLVAGMSWFQTTFTVRCNRQTNQCGHVFAGRYKSVLVQTSSGNYFSQLAATSTSTPLERTSSPSSPPTFSMPTDGQASTGSHKQQKTPPHGTRHKKFSHLSPQERRKKKQAATSASWKK